MAKFLVTFNDVIEDSIELNGFSVMTDKEVLNFEELANSITWPFTYEFEDGTELFYSSGESFLSAITFRELSNEEAKPFARLFNDEFGFFIGESFLRSKIDEEDEDGFDDEEDEDGDIDYYHEY